MLRGASAEALAELGQQATRTRTLDDAAMLGTNLSVSRPSYAATRPCAGP